MARGLTRRRQEFVRQLPIDWNATQAAIRAGYSPRTAYAIGSKLLSFVDVQEALQAETVARAQQMGITQERVLLEIRRIAFAHMGQFAVWGQEGLTPLASGELSEDQLAAVAEVSDTRTRQGRQVRVKLHDKMKALELAARHLGMLQDRGKEEEKPIQITRVTIVLPPGQGAPGIVVEGEVRQVG